MNDEEVDDVLLKAYRFAYSLSNNKEDAEDLVHDACMRILGKNLPLDIWYFIPVVRNLFIDKKRRAKRFFDFHRSLDSNSYVYLTANPEPILELALEKLKPEERELLYLFIVEEYTAQELSELLKKPRGTILSTIHRAKKKLLNLMEEKSIKNE